MHGCSCIDNLRMALHASVAWKSTSAATNVAKRFVRIIQNEKGIPLTHRTLHDILNPQPQMAEVMERFLSWVATENDAFHAWRPKPQFCTEGGEPIFPTDEQWWLTSVQQRKHSDARRRAAEDPDGDGPVSDVEEQFDNGGKDGDEEPDDAESFRDSDSSVMGEESDSNIVECENFEPPPEQPLGGRSNDPSANGAIDGPWCLWSQPSTADQR